MTKRLREWKELVENDPEEGLWELVELARFKILEEMSLYEPETFTYSDQGTEQDLYVRRFLVILSNLPNQTTTKDLTWETSIWKKFSNIMKEIEDTYISNVDYEESGYMTMNILLRGRELFENFTIWYDEKQEEYNEWFIDEIQWNDSVDDRVFISMFIMTNTKLEVRLKGYLNNPVDDIVLRNLMDIIPQV